MEPASNFMTIMAAIFFGSGGKVQRNLSSGDIGCAAERTPPA